MLFMILSPLGPESEECMCVGTYNLGVNNCAFDFEFYVLDQINSKGSRIALNRH